MGVPGYACGAYILIYRYSINGITNLQYASLNVNIIVYFLLTGLNKQIRSSNNMQNYNGYFQCTCLKPEFLRAQLHTAKIDCLYLNFRDS